MIENVIGAAAALAAVAAVLVFLYFPLQVLGAVVLLGTFVALPAVVFVNVRERAQERRKR